MRAAVIDIGSSSIKLLIAQGSGGGNQLGTGSDPLAYFYKNAAFTAIASTSMKDQNDQEQMTMEINCAVLEGKFRGDSDFSKMKSAQFGPQVLAQMKAMGMDRNIVIVRRDKNTMFLIYPGLKSYLEMPFPKGQSLKELPQPKIDKTEIGKETVAGHPCVKSKFVTTLQDGKTINGIIWEATDLNNFPLQSQMNTDAGSVTTLFKDIKLAKPDAVRIPNSVTGRATMEKYLKKNRAVLIQE